MRLPLSCDTNPALEQCCKQFVAVHSSDFLNANLDTEAMLLGSQTVPNIQIIQIEYRFKQKKHC